MSTVAIIQARMQSSRFPGKVLVELAGKPMLVRVVERVRRCLALDRVIVATTTNRADDPIAKVCKARKIALFRGHPTDVLLRYRQCAEAFDATRIVRVTADCPLIDPALIAELLSSAWEAPHTFCSNVHPTRTYPDGLDIECFSRPLLERADREAVDPYDREHVTPWMRAHHDGFLYSQWTTDLSDIRWTVDHPEDCAFPRYAYRHLTEPFSWQDTLTCYHTWRNRAR